MLSTVGDYPHQGRETGKEMLIRNAIEHGIPLDDLPEFAGYARLATLADIEKVLLDRMRDRLDRYTSPHFSARTNPAPKPDPEKVKFLSGIFMDAMKERIER